MPEREGSARYASRFGAEERAVGSRVIYYFCDETMPVFLMQIYAKNDKANLTAAEKNQLKQLSEEFKRRHRR